MSVLAEHAIASEASSTHDREMPDRAPKSARRKGPKAPNKKQICKQRRRHERKQRKLAELASSATIPSPEPVLAAGSHAPSTSSHLIGAYNSAGRTESAATTVLATNVDVPRTSGENMETCHSPGAIESYPTGTLMDSIHAPHSSGKLGKIKLPPNNFCAYCGKGYSGWRQLVVHVVVYCLQAPWTQEELEYHLLGHSAPMPITILSATSTPSGPTLIEFEFLLLEAPTQRKRYSCNNCVREFQDLASVLHHVMSSGRCVGRAGGQDFLYHEVWKALGTLMNLRGGHHPVGHGGSAGRVQAITQEWDLDVDMRL